MRGIAYAAKLGKSEFQAISGKAVRDGFELWKEKENRGGIKAVIPQNLPGGFLSARSFLPDFLLRPSAGAAPGHELRMAVALCRGLSALGRDAARADQHGQGMDVAISLFFWNTASHGSCSPPPLRHGISGLELYQTGSPEKPASGLVCSQNVTKPAAGQASAKAVPGAALP